MIVATAGHVDHGKTALVKALTGVDTDRLPEEKARGISIDLGFAYMATPSGGTIGFVDVLGHERFVRNMIAGVCGIDYVMLVIAADDGVMPQTREHLAIVDLLGVTRGIVVISKVDSVPRQRVHALREEATALLDATALRGCVVVETSAVSGTGVEALRTRLLAAGDAHTRSEQKHRGFRYAIDRAFSVAGSGTVVTGTVFQGMVTRGDRLRLAPSGDEVRIRGIQRAGVAVDAAHAGERCALNLAGIERERVGRGQWVVAECATTRRIDVRLRALSDSPPLRHWTAVHFHIGTADVSARIAIAGSGSIGSGASGIAQLVCDTDVSAVVGDRFILRDPSAMRTLAGGIVLDPFPPARKLSRALRAEQLSAFATLSPEQVLRGLLALSDAGLDLDTFGRAFNLDRAYRDELVRTCGGVVVGEAPTVALRESRVDKIANDVVVTLARFHEQSPQAQGLDLEVLRRQVAPALRGATFAALVRNLPAAMRVEVIGSTVRRAGHVATANRADEILWQRVRPALLEAGVRGAVLRDLASDLGVREPLLADFLHRKRATGEVIRVAADRFYARDVLAQLAALATDLAAQAPDQSFIAATFRDHAGVNR
ncbi:MAG TPA: selenocysteine-specific translation elongation factor, partial [Casimicrobiaceae bacterium]|nr:selenocysteine-specific translation elongation factor [Casimicrobiaceae bacterium]